MRDLLGRLLAALALVMASTFAGAQTAGAPGPDPLSIVSNGRAVASVIVADDAGEQEKLAAADLVKYVEMMSGARLPVHVAVRGAALPAGPAIVLGKAALAQDASLAGRLRAAARQKPVVQADAIVLRRSGERLYVAGNSDSAHYFAVSRLLQAWGCRWYLPTPFGEVVPEQRDLSVGTLDLAYGSPFEIRNFWLAWLGDPTGSQDFRRRNFASTATLPGAGHTLAKYTKSLVPPGKSALNVPLSDPATAAEVARHLEADYAKGVPGITLGIEDGIYRSDSESDAALQAGIFDKYMLAPSQTDAVITLYNNVARILREKYPASPTLIGGLAYSNVTLPPQRVTKIEPHVAMWLAPIDIDPNHGMDHADSPPRQEYKAMMYRWAELLGGRLAIYDYDQGQLVWRDLPNPSHHVFRQDVQHYRKAGILGVGTESRGAFATTFLNLFFRLQLLWDPDADVDAMLAEFYPKFYGPAAAPMAAYWTAIYNAWRDTLATEHEHYVAPVIYTPELIDELRRHLAAGMQAIEPLKAKAAPSRNEKLYLERMEFTRLSFAVIENYLAMVRAAAREADYAAAVAAGERTLLAREQLTALSPIFTTYKRMGEKGYAWLPGEVQQMRELAALTDGTRGKLVTRLPLAWSFRRDAHDTGLARGWAYTRADLSQWQANGARMSLAARKDYPDAWELLRTDVYAQGEGIRHADGQSFNGFLWYQTEVELTAEQAASGLHIHFPGVFNGLWLYVNGYLVATRTAQEPWWKTDYRFEWDVDLAGQLKSGRNLVVLRAVNVHHFGGMFRRPFLYRAVTR
ncbi:MAG TPA: DUF4838 domain-containing protein [Ramlibacter sp.]|uniref:DUF4838 domain-containing protein n=1 Tax=Ramlibacter sp. TaxID=1917967 RepID=UPI002ED58DFA